jgi:hypothetical protein
VITMPVGYNDEIRLLEVDVETADILGEKVSVVSGVEEDALPWYSISAAKPQSRTGRGLRASYDSDSGRDRRRASGLAKPSATGEENGQHVTQVAAASAVTATALPPRRSMGSAVGFRSACRRSRAAGARML